MQVPLKTILFPQHMWFVYPSARLLFHKVHPVFVFDGATPALKRNTHVARRRRRELQSAALRRAAEKLLMNQIKRHTLLNLQQSQQESEAPDQNQQPPPSKRRKVRHPPAAQEAAAMLGSTAGPPVPAATAPRVMASGRASSAPAATASATQEGSIAPTAAAEAEAIAEAGPGPSSSIADAMLTDEELIELQAALQQSMVTADPSGKGKMPAVAPILAPLATDKHPRPAAAVDTGRGWRDQAAGPNGLNIDAMLAAQLEADDWTDDFQAPANRAAGSGPSGKPSATSTAEPHASTGGVLNGRLAGRKLGSQGSIGGGEQGMGSDQDWEPNESNDAGSVEDEDDDDDDGGGGGLRPFMLPEDGTTLDAEVLSTLPQSVQLEILEKLRDSQQAGKDKPLQAAS